VRSALRDRSSFSIPTSAFRNPGPPVVLVQSCTYTTHLKSIILHGALAGITTCVRYTVRRHEEQQGIISIMHIYIYIERNYL
jgi:hypothetical protein